jgi:hypothetical protein
MREGEERVSNCNDRQLLSAHPHGATEEDCKPIEKLIKALTPSFLISCAIVR